MKEPFNTSDRLYGLDHLRTLAIAIVFLFHYQISVFGHPKWLESMARFGWTGVDLFFVLSGFLIASGLFAQIGVGKQIAFGNFFLKRAFRIFPAFFVVISIYYCIPAFHEREALPPLWKFMTFTQNIGLNIRDNGTFSHAWSLCVEEHFYLFLPLLLLGLQRMGLFGRSWWLLIVLFGFGLAIRAYSWYALYLPQTAGGGGGVAWYKFIYYPTWTRLDGLLTGVAIAAIYRFYPQTWQRVAAFGNWLLPVGILLLASAYALCTGNEQSFAASVFGFPLIALGFGSIVAGAVSPKNILYRWSSRATTFLAALSYAFYLVHKGVIHIVQELFSGTIDTNGNGMLLLCIAGCIVAAYALHKLVEQPFMQLRKRLLGKHKRLKNEK